MLIQHGGLQEVLRFMRTEQCAKVCNKESLKKKIADETREGGYDSDETRLQTLREKITFRAVRDGGRGKIRG